MPGGTDIIQGNDLVQSLEIIANPLPGPDYEIVTPMRVWVPNERKQSESKAEPVGMTNAQQADWVVGNCQGMGPGAAGQALAKVAGRSPGAAKSALISGSLSRKLVKTGEGEVTKWALAG